MRIAKRMLALTISLLVQMMTTVHAEVPFLVHSNGWTMEDTAVEALLKADVDTHMPFDQDRLAMLTPITDMLSLRLVTGGDEGSVTISAADEELLMLQYRGNEVQLSSVPDITYMAESDPMSVLLGADVSAEGGYEALGLARDGETLLTDGRTLLEKTPTAFEEHGKRSTSTLNISGYGRAAYIMDYTFTAKQTEEFKNLLLGNCPEGWLREIISGLTFSGKQTVRMYFTSEDVLLRMEYNGSCGPQDNLRTVKLVYKLRHDTEMDKDYIELTSPAKKGKSKNNLTFERTIQTNKKGARVIEGSYKYTVIKDEVTSIWDGEFNLSNAYTDASDVITGEATFQTKLNGAEKYDAVTFAPNITISGTEDAPVITGTMEITEKYAGKVTEHAVISIDLKRAGELAWMERPRTVDLSAMDATSLAAAQQEAAASVATALVRPLIVMMGKDAQWFFRDLSEETIQAIIDAANAAQQPKEAE